MSLSDKTIDTVQKTWAVAVKIEGVTDTFYDRLFTIRPDYKTTLFGRTSVKAQAKMLASMIDTAVQNLRNPDVLIPALQQLGMRHCGYGCRPEHYGPVGEALLWTLAFYFKDAFTPDVKAAWTEVYGVIQTVMCSQLETEEGKRLLAQYESKYPSPSDTKKPGCGCNCNLPVIVAVVAVVGIGAAIFMRSRKN